MKKLKIIYLISTIIFLLLGVIQCWRWSYFGGTLTSGWLLNFLPASVFFIAFLIAPDIKRKIWHFLTVFICISAVLFWVLMGMGIEILFSAISPVTDVNQYEEILENRWGKGFMKPFIVHFPETLPENQKNIHFFFRPAFMQGGSHIQLRMKTTREKIDKLYEQYIKQKMTFPESSDNPRELEPEIHFNTGDSKNYKFPNDYEIMIFESRRGNHGQNYGVAISKKRNEIVYFAEYW